MVRYKQQNQIPALKPVQSFFRRMDSDSIYSYTAKILSIKRRLEQFDDDDDDTTGNGKVASEFLDALGDHGLSKGRVVYYAARLPIIMKWFANRRMTLKNATKDDCKDCVRSIISDKYAGKTNRAFAEAIKRLVHFAKTGEIGEKKDGKDYVPEVSWIRPEVYVKNGRKREIRPGDLLTGEEIEALLDAIPKISRFPGRDRAMVMCLYEGAFRPGELLNMTVGGVLFKDKVAVVTTVGKTGEKTVPLLLSYRLLLDWIEQHPFKDNLDAPLWWSFATCKVIGYGYLRKVVKKAASEAGIRKKVWNYLLRHTKLTDVAKKHPDQILKRFGNWKKGTEMMDVYIHLSESDLEEAVLKEHGLLPVDGKKSGLALKTCPRCGEQNAVGTKRCTKCGYIIDEKLAIKIAHREQSALEGLTRTVKEHEHVQKKIFRMLEELTGTTTKKKAVISSPSA
jgi:integrase/recombinase XerD